MGRAVPVADNRGVPAFWKLAGQSRGCPHLALARRILLRSSSSREELLGEQLVPALLLCFLPLFRCLEEEDNVPSVDLLIHGRP